MVGIFMQKPAVAPQYMAMLQEAMARGVISSAMAAME